MADIIDAMTRFNNLILGGLLAKQKYHYIPSARRYLDAHPRRLLSIFLDFKKALCKPFPKGPPRGGYCHCCEKGRPPITGITMNHDHRPKQV